MRLRRLICHRLQPPRILSYGGQGEADPRLPLWMIINYHHGSLITITWDLGSRQRPDACAGWRGLGVAQA